MSNKQKPSRTKKGVSVGIVVCFMAAIVMAGTYALNGYREAKKEELAKAEEELSEIVNTEDLVADTENEDGDDTEEEYDTSNQANALDGEEQSEDEAGEMEGTVQTSLQTAGANVSVNFTEDSQILWPVDGNLLMGYSMDQTVYFSTLDQYKYNPAMIIAGAEGDQVIAGAAGVVKSIDVTAQTGTTVNIDLGNGYEVFYGQLKDVPLNVGDYVTSSTVVGYVAQPTKYYVAEGCNVYFEMRKDGQPIDPLEYIEK